MEKQIIGLTEQIILIGNNAKKKVNGRIDTGATHSAMDVKLASELNLGPSLTTKRIRSAHGITTRPVVNVKIELAGVCLNGEFTLIDRSHMKYRVLIGQNILKKGNFLIDPTK